MILTLSSYFSPGAKAMKTPLTILVTAVLLTSVPAPAATSNFGVLINLGPPVPAAPVAPMASAPVKVIPTPGVSLEVGVPYELTSYGDRYYARQLSKWYSSRYSNGPWQPISWSVLPVGIQHQFEAVRDQRPVVYGEDDEGSQGGEQSRRTVKDGSKGASEGYVIDRGRNRDRRDNDEKR